MDTDRHEPATDERREDYAEPQIEEWGTVGDVTETGLTNPGGDAKSGSRPSRGA